MRRGMVRGLAWGLAVAALPGPAQAHLVGVEFGAFYAGALHLIMAPEHGAGLLALALATAVQPRERAWISLAILPAALMLGALAGLLASIDRDMAPWIGASLILAGAVGTIGRALPWAMLGGLAAAIGAIHGYANGLSALGTEVDSRLYGAGIVIAGTVIGTLLIGLSAAALELHPVARLGARVVASWVTTVGLLFLALTLLNAG